MKQKMIVVLILVVAIGFSACGGGNRVIDPPANGGGVMKRPAFISKTDLVIMESYPVQVMVAVSGDLPTPCDQLQIDIATPNENNEIMVEVYSIVGEEQICITVLEPFNKNIPLPLEGLADGEYSVFVNGELVGKFTYPA